MKVLCVLNLLAAGGSAAQRWPTVADLLRRLGVTYELLADEKEPLAVSLGRRFETCRPEEWGVIAGVGGDGTHSAIFNFLMEYGREHPNVVLPPYAFIPLGTGNDIAKSFGLNSRDDFFVSDLRRSVSTILHGADYRLDLGILNGVYFADAFTIGLDSHVLRLRNAQKKRIERIPVLRHLARGSFLYTSALGVLFWKHRPLDAEVVVDGSCWYVGPILNMVVNNTRIYAGGFDLSTDTYADDGLLDVVLFTGHTDYLRKYSLAIRHNPDKIREFSDRLHRMSSHVQGRRIHIRLSRAEAAQLDGEEIPGAADFDIGVVPRAIAIKTPAEPA